MDPISLAIAGVGLGMQLFGMSQSSKAAEHDSQLSQQISKFSQDEATHEQGINDLKQQQMELEGRRSQLENVRNNQRARAMATNAAVSQGAQQGSGLMGGLAQIDDQSIFNMTGVNAALQTGRDINTQNQAISQDKIQVAGLQGQRSQAQSDMAQGQAWSSLGGSIMKAGPVIGQISQGFGGGVTKAMNLFSPGSLSGGYGSA